MSHKRALSEAETPLPKRQNQITPNDEQPANPPTTNITQYVYIATEEMYGPDIETTELFEAFATLEDAHRRVRTRQQASDFHGWEEEYDRDGNLRLGSEDTEGWWVKLEVLRMVVQPAGSVPTPATPSPSSEDSGDVGESGSEIYDSEGRLVTDLDDDEDNGEDYDDIDDFRVKRARVGRRIPAQRTNDFTIFLGSILKTAFGCVTEENSSGIYAPFQAVDWDLLEHRAKAAHVVVDDGYMKPLSETKISAGCEKCRERHTEVLQLPEQGGARLSDGVPHNFSQAG